MAKKGGDKMNKIFKVVLMVSFVFFLFGCATTCKTTFRNELSGNPQLSEANISYKKATRLITQGDCTHNPAEAQKAYESASQYLSDALFKLEQLGHDNSIDVSEEVYYCQKLKSEIEVKKNEATKEMLGP